MSASSSTTRMRPFVVFTKMSCLEAVNSGIHRFSSQGELETELRARAKFALHLNSTTVFLNDAVADRETQASALAAGFRGEERIVNALQMLVRNALSCVGDLNAHHVIFAGGCHRQRTAAFHRVARVEHEIQEDLLEFAGVPLDASEIGCEMHIDAHPGFFQLMADQRYGIGDDAVQVDIVELRGRSAREI